MESQVKDFKTKIKNGNFIVYFFASWCPSCKILNTYFNQIEEKFKNDYNFIKLSFDDFKPVFEEVGITSVPIVALFKNGQIINFVKGNSEKDIYSLLNSHK